MDAQRPQQDDEARISNVWLFGISLVGQLGFMIAVPIAALAYLGRFLDIRWGTSPIYLLGGTLLASIFSAVWISQRARTLRDRYLDIFAPPEKKKL